MRWIWPVLVALALGAVVVARALVPGSDGVSVWRNLAEDLTSAEAYYLPEYQLDPTKIATLRHLDQRWRAVDPAAGAFVSEGPEASVFFHVVTGSASLLLDIEPKWKAGATDNRVRLKVNGKRFTVFLASSRTVHRSRIRPELLRHGVNNIEIFCREAISFTVRAFALSAQAETHASSATRFPQGSAVRGTGNAATIVQVPGAHLSFLLRPPPHSQLAFVLPWAWGTRRARYRVRVESASRPDETVFEGLSGWKREVRVPLERFQGEPVRLTFDVESRSKDATSRATVFSWHAPRILVPDQRAPGEAKGKGVAGLGAQGQMPVPEGRPNIVLYVIDALRADHLASYGYARDTSPNISRFATQATLFENAFANSNWTKPSVGTLLTGLYPADHGAANDVRTLKSSVKTLSTYLKANGYTCLAFQANGNAGTAYGFSRDFSAFLGELDLKRPFGVTRDSSRLIHEALLERWDELREPFFLFIQAVDPHYPYDPQGEFRRYVETHPLRGRPVTQVFAQWMARQDDGSKEFRDQTSYLVGLYDGSIRHNDRYFGELINVLVSRGLFDRTAILLTADHGEAFKEHGFEFHHSGFYQHTVRVPLVFKPPGSREPHRARTPVQHLDVVPTVLQLAGVKTDGLPGQSLMTTEGWPARSIRIFRYRDKDPSRFPHDGWALVSWPWKIIQENAWRPGYEIYNLERDPEEKWNLWKGPTDSSVLTSFLVHELRRHSPTLTTGDSESTEVPLEAIDREALRALGYIQ